MSEQPSMEKAQELDELVKVIQHSDQDQKLEDEIIEVDDNFKQKTQNEEISNFSKSIFQKLRNAIVQNSEENKSIIDQRNKENSTDKEDKKNEKELEEAHDLYLNFLQQEAKQNPIPVKIKDYTSFFGIDKYKNVIYYNEDRKILKIGSVREFDDYSSCEEVQSDVTSKVLGSSIVDDSLFHEKKVTLDFGEKVTTLTVDNENGLVYLGTNLHILIYSSVNFKQKAKKKTESKVKQILIADKKCFVLLSNMKIFKFSKSPINDDPPTELSQDNKLKEKLENIEYLAFKLSNKKEYLAAYCRAIELQKFIPQVSAAEKSGNSLGEFFKNKNQTEKEESKGFLRSITNVVYDQFSFKIPKYSILIFHLEQSQNQEKINNNSKNNDDNKIENFIGYYPNVKLHKDEYTEIFKVIPDWLCFSQKDDSIFIRDQLVNISELFLDQCSLKRDQKKIYQSGLYISKMQSFKDENIIVCSAKGPDPRNNIRIVDLFKKTSTILKTQYAIQDFAVTKDQEWIFTMGAYDLNNENIQLELYNLNSQKYHNISTVSNKNRIFISSDDHEKDVIMYMHDSSRQETFFFQLENIDKIQCQEHTLFEDQRYSLVDYYNQKCKLDRKYQIPVVLYKNFTFEFIYEDFIYGKRQIGQKYQIIRINTKKDKDKNYEEEVICEPDETGDLIFKITKNHAFLFYQTREGLFCVDIKTKELLDSIKVERKTGGCFQFQFQEDEKMIFAFFQNEGIQVDYSDPNHLLKKNHKSTKDDLQIKQISIVGKDNQFMILNQKDEKMKKGEKNKNQDPFQYGLRILNLKDFIFIDINNELIVYEFQVLEGGQHVFINKDVLFQFKQNQLVQVLQISNHNIVYKLGKNKELEQTKIDDIIYKADMNFHAKPSNTQLNKLHAEINPNQISLMPKRNINDNDNKDKNKERSKMFGDYCKLMLYFIEDFNEQKFYYKEDEIVKMDQYLQVLIASLTKITRQADNYNFLSYLVLCEEKEQFLKQALKSHDIPYLKDALGFYPLDYAIKKYDYKKTNILIDFLSKNQENMVLTSHQQFLEILKFSPSKLSLFLEKSIIQVPKSAEIGIDKDENFEDFITLNKIENNIKLIEKSLLKEDAKDFEKRPIVIEQLSFRLNLNNGSEESLLLQLALHDCEHRQVFEKRAIKQIIKYKWQKIQLLAQIIAFFQFTFLFFVTLNLYMPGYIETIIILFIYSGLFLIKESFIFIMVWSLRKKVSFKFNNVYNILLVPFLLVYCSMMLSNHTFYVEYLLPVIVLLGWLGFVIQIKFTETFREFITIFLLSFKSITGFIFFFILMILAFTFVQVFIKRTMDRNEVFQKAGYEKIEFTHDFYEQNGLFLNASYGIDEGAQQFYQIWLAMLGQGTNSDLNYFQEVFYLVVTFILQVTLLNILVAQYGDTFDKYQQSKEIIDGRIQNKIIIEIEIYQFLNRNKQDHTFLMWMDYEKDQNDSHDVQSILDYLKEENSQNDQFKKDMKSSQFDQQEKLKSLRRRLMELENYSKEKLDEICKQITKFVGQQTSAQDKSSISILKNNENNQSPSRSQQLAIKQSQKEKNKAKNDSETKQSKLTARGKSEINQLDIKLPNIEQLQNQISNKEKNKQIYDDGLYHNFSDTEIDKE